MLRFVPLAAAAALAMAAGAAAQDRLIALDSNRNVYELDMATAARTLIGQVSTNAGTAAGFAYDRSTGTLYLTSSSNDSLFTVNLTTFEATLVGAYDPTSTAFVMHGLEFDDSTGTLYGGSSHTEPTSLYTIDRTTGLATLVGPSTLTSFMNLGYDINNDVMYASHSGDDSFYVVDRSTGNTTLIGPLNGPTNPHGLAYNSTTSTMYLICSSTDTLYTVDLATGSATAVGSPGSGNYLGLVFIPGSTTPSCYANCDESTSEPVLNVADFSCFLTRFAAGEAYANCDASTSEPTLNVADFSCFLTKFAAGCP